eukprot:5549581-Ditylum_brightwellii.AAC.1
MEVKFAFDGVAVLADMPGQFSFKMWKGMVSAADAACKVGADCNSTQEIPFISKTGEDNWDDLSQTLCDLRGQ